MKPEILIRELSESEIPEALSLVWKTFLEFEAPDYSEEGIAEFRKSINAPEYLSQLRIFGAFDEKKLMGVIATRMGGNHIALFFVDGKYHRKGIGKRLFQIVKAECSDGKITVNSSPYAVEIYKRLGFCPTDSEQTVTGIRFTPMEFVL